MEHSLDPQATNVAMNPFALSWQNAFLAAALAPALVNENVIGDINFEAAVVATAMLGTAYAFATLYSANRRQSHGPPMTTTTIEHFHKSDFVQVFGGQDTKVNAGPEWILNPAMHTAGGKDHISGLLGQAVDDSSLCFSDSDIALKAVEIAQHRKSVKQLGVPSVVATTTLSPLMINAGGSGSQSGTSTAVSSVSIKVPLEMTITLQDHTSSTCINEPFHVLSEQAPISYSTSSANIRLFKRGTVIQTNDLDLSHEICKLIKTIDSFLSQALLLFLGSLFFLVSLLLFFFIWISLIRATIFLNNRFRTSRRRLGRKRARESLSALGVIPALAIVLIIIVVATNG